jgi:hypothetical protein
MYYISENSKNGTVSSKGLLCAAALKVVDNEKLGGSRGWLLVEGDTGLWRSMSVYFLM